MVEIKLDPTEKRIAYLVAKKVTDENKSFGNAQRVDKKVSQLEADYEAFMAEMAVCKYLDVYPKYLFRDFVPSIAAGTDVGDINYKNIAIDVKHTRYKTGRLIAYKKNPRVDLLILVTGSGGEYTIVGGMQAKDFYVKERFTKPKNFAKACFVADQKELTPVDKIILDMVA